VNDELLRLDKQLCFPLYVAAKEVVSRYKPFLDEIDLTYTQYITMMVMWENNTVTVKELGEHLHLDSGTLTPLLKRLQSKGYVRRYRSSDDERVVYISITDEGEKLKEIASSIPGKMMSCMNLDAKEAVLLYDLLYKVIGSGHCLDNQ